MAKTIITAIFALLTGIAAHAQNKGVKLTEVLGADNAIHVMAEPSGYGNFTIWLTVTETHNAKDAPTIPYETTCTINGKTEILSLYPQDVSKPAKAEYYIDWINGKVNTLPDLEFIYRVPVEDKTKTTIKSITPAQADMARNNTSNFRIWQFSAKAGEPVFAVREGVVIHAEDSGRPESGDDQWAGAMAIIEHSDGTQAIYSGIIGGTLTIKEGDTISSSQRIGSAGKFFDSTAGVRVGVYNYISNRNKAAHPTMKIQNDFINPLYSTSEGNMILEDGISVVAKVSSKKKFCKRY